MPRQVVAVFLSWLTCVYSAAVKDSIAIARNEQAERFVSWLDSIEGVDRRATVRWISHDYGFGLASDARYSGLDDGSLLIQMPLRAVISKKSVLGDWAQPAKPSSATQDRLQRVWQHLDDDADLIALWMMRARALGALRASGLEAGPGELPRRGDSKSTSKEPDLSDPAEWWPYINVLPRGLSIPASWPAGPLGLGQLHDERFQAEATRHRESLLDRYARALPAIREVFHDFSAQRMSDAVAAYASLEKNISVLAAREAGYGVLTSSSSPTAFVKATPLPSATGSINPLTGLAASAPAGVSVLPGVGLSHDSLASFFWAATVADSRYLTIRGTRLLVPFADMINFQPAPGATARKAALGETFATYHQLDSSRGTFRVLTDRRTTPGSEIYEDYGDNDSGLYLKHHGMMPAVVNRTIVPYVRSNAGTSRTADEEDALNSVHSWSHVKVTHVDSIAANPFDCLRVSLPALRVGPKGSVAEKRRHLARSLGLSGNALNRTCARPPVASSLDGSGREMFNVSAPDPLPMEVHRWLAISMLTEKQLDRPACNQILSFAAMEAKRRAVDKSSDDGNDVVPAFAAGTASSGGGGSVHSNVDAPTPELIDECLVLGSYETHFLQEEGRRNVSFFVYGDPSVPKMDDDGSAPTMHDKGKSQGDLFLTPHPLYHPKSASGRAARLFRMTQAMMPTKLFEDLALISALATKREADAAGVPAFATHTMVESCVSAVHPPGRQRWLISNTFGKASGFLPRVRRGHQINDAMKKKMADDMGPQYVAKDFDEEAKEDKEMEEDPNDEGAPLTVDLERARLALLYRASRKTMLRSMQTWYEEVEAVTLARVKEEIWLAGSQSEDSKEDGTEGMKGPALAARAVADIALLDAQLQSSLSNASAAPPIAIGLVEMSQRDGACYFTEDEFESAAAACEAFNAWFSRLLPAVSAVKAVPVGGGMRLGVVTTRVVEPEEVYLAAPLDGILDSEAARRDRTLGPVLSALRKKYPSGDDFHELLMLLLLEKGVRHGAAGGPGSVFGPYINVLPDADHMPFPVFFTPTELSGLLGSSVLRSLLDYRQGVRSKYVSLRGAVLDVYPKTFVPAQAFALPAYRWATAILDSRAIWWGGSRHLVPLLDLINCGEGGVPGRVHATRLDPRGEYAVTRADRPYAAGEQLWENYGQPNWIYFAYHGFSMSGTSNSYDCVRMELELPPVMEGAVEREMTSSRRAMRSRRKGNTISTGAVGAEGESDASRHSLPRPSADAAAWAAMAKLLQPPLAREGEGRLVPKWLKNDTLSLPWARSVLLNRREKGPAGRPASVEESAESTRKVAAWLSNQAISDETHPYRQAAAGLEEEGMQSAESALWDSYVALAASASPLRSLRTETEGRHRIFSVQCIKVDALMPSPAQAENVTLEVGVDVSSGGGAPSRSPPRSVPHAETEEAIDWLRWGWGTDRLGALLLLRAHARAALGRYPTRLAADVRALLADAAAQLVLGLAPEEDASAAVTAILQGVYGAGHGQGWPDVESSVMTTVMSGLPGSDSEDGLLPGLYPLGRFTLVQWQSEVLAQAREATARGSGKLARARAALLAPRVRSSLLFLVSEKVQLLVLAGWDPLGRGLDGRYHPAAGACGPGEGGKARAGTGGQDGSVLLPCATLLNLPDGEAHRRRSETH